MRTTPLTIKFMLACYCSPEPAELVGLQQWMSPAGCEVRDWLRSEGLIDDDNRATARGEAWVHAICATPLPVAVWVSPDFAGVRPGAASAGGETAPAHQPADR